MNCHQFRAAYSDFADGLLDEAAEVAFHIHMAECAACLRFDEAVRNGVSALREMGPPTPSGEFDARLSHRLTMESLNPEPALRHWSGVASAVLILAAVGVAGWEARAWISPSARESRQVARRSGDRVNPFVVHFAGDTTVDYRGHFPVIPVSRDTFQRPTRPAQSFEITVDWMVP